MKRKILFTVFMVLMLIGLTVPFATPVFASQITATKGVNPSSPNIYHVGDTIHYVMTIENPAGNVGVVNTLTDIHDHLPNGTTFYFVNPGVDPPLVQNPGETASFNLDYVIGAGDLVTLVPSGLTGVINEFHVVGSDSNGDLVTAEVQKNSQVIQPAIAVTKTVIPTTSKVGDSVSYNITITNTGDTELGNITVSDTILGDLSASFADNLTAGASESHAFPYTIQVGDPDPLVNVVTVSGTDALALAVTDTASATVDLVQPSIDITKTVNPTTSKVGDSVSYNITITNTGNIGLEGITVSDTILGDLSGSFADTLAIGASESHAFPYTIQVGDPDPLVNTVTVHANPEGPLTNDITDTASATVDLVQPGIDITKTVNPTTSKVGDSVSYNITITNTGNIGLEGITVSDSILGDLSGSFADTLAIGASESHAFPYTIQVGDPDPLVNTVTVHANPEGPLTNDITDTASATVDLVQPGIDITKTVNPTTSKVGDSVSYNITITNTGNIGLEGITVSDSKLGDLSGSFADTLAIGASESHSFPYTIQVGDPDPLVNTVTVHANPEGPLTNDITDTAGPVRVDLVHPSIDITKVANPTSGSVGTMITYTITITNTSPDIALEGITVVDSLLGDLSATFVDTLGIGASDSHNVTRALQAGDPDPLVNTVTVHANPAGPLTNDITDTASATVDITGAEGLTPGFWKNHTEAWEVYTTNQTLESVFDVPDSLNIDNVTLLEALSFKGGPGVNGAAQILLRAAVAALLNSTSSLVDYPLSTADVISQVNTALASLDRDTMLNLASQLDAFNNLGGG